MSWIVQAFGSGAGGAVGNAATPQQPMDTKTANKAQAVAKTSMTNQRHAVSTMINPLLLMTF